MSDTTAVNTGKKVAGVNKRLADFYKLRHDRNIYSLECLFHLNKFTVLAPLQKLKAKRKDREL